ncbi:MAG: DUF4340 domain-containing protein [Clostridiales bacterium]|nr:DUF4340 domain-containing protein [Clostridiales bacterium]
MRSFKSLLIPLIIMVLLVTGVIIYFVTSPGSGSSATDPSDTPQALIVSTEDLRSVSVRKPDGSAPLIKVLIEKVSEELSYNYVYYGEDKDLQATYSQNKMSDYAAALSSFGGELINGDAPLSEYGLDTPDYIVTVELVSGESHTVNIGRFASDKKYVYISIDGRSDVFMVSSDKAEFAAYKGSDLLESQILDLDYSNMESVRFTRTTDGLDIAASVTLDQESQYPVYSITKPLNRDSSVNFATLMNRMAKLDITSFVEMSSGDLSSYGLDKPSFTVVFTNKDSSTVTIHISANLAGCYYGFIEGSDEYFKLSERDYSLLEAQALSFIDPYVAYYNASELSSIKGTYKDQSFVFKLDVDEKEAISDEHATCELDGRNAKIFNSEGRSYCAMFFESIVCMEIGGIDTSAAPALKDPVTTLTFIGKDYKTNTYDIVSRSADSYYVFENGEYTGYYVFEKALFNNGGQDTYSYGVWEAFKLLNTAISENIGGVYDIPAE